jgi:hypothetical protein
VSSPSPGLSGLREAISTASLYGSTVLRVLPRALRSGGFSRNGAEERLVFVVGAPRSGTTFVARSLGAQPAFVDLGEVQPLKAAIPELVELSEPEACVRLRDVLDRVRRLAFARHLRTVEQTPEVSFVVRPALRAYPRASALHMIRDGRDVVASLLERGWLSAGRGGQDDAGATYGAYARFWVEEERREEFVRASDAARAAWAWRRYVTAARARPERTLEVHYEELAADPAGTAARIAGVLGVADAAPLQAGLSGAHGRSVGRWRTELTPAQIGDVEREAGDLLRELGYD